MCPDGALRYVPIAVYRFGERFTLPRYGGGEHTVHLFVTYDFTAFTRLRWIRCVRCHTRLRSGYTHTHHIPLWNHDFTYCLTPLPHLTLISLHLLPFLTFAARGLPVRWIFLFTLIYRCVWLLLRCDFVRGCRIRSPIHTPTPTAALRGSHLPHLHTLPHHTCAPARSPHGCHCLRVVPCHAHWCTSVQFYLHDLCYTLRGTPPTTHSVTFIPTTCDVRLPRCCDGNSGTYLPHHTPPTVTYAVRDTTVRFTRLIVSLPTHVALRLHFGVIWMLLFLGLVRYDWMPTLIVVIVRLPRYAVGPRCLFCLILRLR